jgi:ubiquitin-like protein Pup
MAVREHKQAAVRARTEAEEDAPPQDIRDEDLAVVTDDILAEIDEVLSEIGEEFALTFVQQGGE